MFLLTETTINIDKEIRDSLNECKKYKRETYDEILKDLIKSKKKLTEEKINLMSKEAKMYEKTINIIKNLKSF